MITLLGIFSSRLKAEDALTDLQTNGYRPQDISIIMRDQKTAKQISDEKGVNVVKGAASGVTIGGVMGGLAGLLVGVGTIVVPGIGGLLVGGPIAALFGLTGAAATTLTGAVTGALAGGLVGVLVGLGIPEHEAKQYESAIKEGGILLAVPVITGQEAEARRILAKYDADMIRAIHTSEHSFEDEYEYPKTRYNADDFNKAPAYNETPAYRDEIKEEKPTEEVITPRAARNDYDDTGSVYYSDLRRNNDFDTYGDEPEVKPNKSFKDKIRDLFR